MIVLGSCLNGFSQVTRRGDSTQHYQFLNESKDSSFNFKTLHVFNSKGLLVDNKAYQPQDVKGPTQRNLKLTSHNLYIYDEKDRVIESSNHSWSIGSNDERIQVYKTVYQDDRKDVYIYQVVDGDSTLIRVQATINNTPTTEQIDLITVQNGVQILSYRTIRYGDSEDLDSVQNFSCSGENDCRFTSRVHYSTSKDLMVQTSYYPNGEINIRETRNYNDTLETVVSGSASGLNGLIRWSSITHTRFLGAKTLRLTSATPKVDGDGKPLDLSMTNVGQKSIIYINEKAGVTYTMNHRRSVTTNKMTPTSTNVQYWTSVGDPIGIDDRQNYLLSTYPNPAIDVLQIETSLAISKTRILSVDGHLIREDVGRKSIDISDLTQGLYLLQVSTSEGIATTRFVKSK